MPLPPATPETIEALIAESGFPFELEVAQALQKAGYEVQLSVQYFNATRQRANEIDIRATRDFPFKTKRAGAIRAVLELVIECKDNGLPYVLFGFPSPPPPEPGMLDTDLYYCKLRSTQDDFANQLAFIALGDSRLGEEKPIKPSHHQFAAPFRFHQAVAVEPKDGKLKLNVSDRLRDALHGLIGYTQFVQATMVEANRGILKSGMPFDPSVWITFHLLVHRTPHFEHTGAGTLRTAPITTLFSSVYETNLSTPFAVDFVHMDALSSALKQIETTFSLLAAHVLRYIEPSPRPLTGAV
jgi:hypothetical protein